MAVQLGGCDILSRVVIGTSPEACATWASDPRLRHSLTLPALPALPALPGTSPRVGRRTWNTSRTVTTSARTCRTPGSLAQVPGSPTTSRPVKSTGNFDIVLNQCFSRISQLHTTEHAPCDMLYCVFMLIGCSLVLRSDVVTKFGASDRPRRSTRGA